MAGDGIWLYDVPSGLCWLLRESEAMDSGRGSLESVQALRSTPASRRGNSHRCARPGGPPLSIAYWGPKRLHKKKGSHIQVPKLYVWGYQKPRFLGSLCSRGLLVPHDRPTTATVRQAHRFSISFGVYSRQDQAY